MRPEKRSNSATIVVVSLGWKGDTLAAGSARPGQALSLGDAEGAIAPLPADVLGAPSLTIADADGGPHVRVPDGKVASIRTPAGQMRLVVGPARVPLATDEEATLLFGAFDVVVTALANEPAPQRRSAIGGAWTHTALAAAVHAALLFAGSRTALAAQLEDTGPNVEQMRSYLAAVEDRSAAADQVREGLGGNKGTAMANGHAGNGVDGGGERHEGDEGKAGASESRATAGHWSATAKPSKSSGTPVVDDIETARSFGMVSLLSAMQGNAGQPGAVGAAANRDDSPWGAADPFLAVGKMLGHDVGESEGLGGLGLTGIGEGGGGRGDGIGLGAIGTIGHADGLPGIGTGGTGFSTSGGQGFGWGHSRLRGRHSSPVWRSSYCCGSWVSGRLPPEAIQRIVRSNFGRFRACYQDGLKRNPALEGRVTARFVIGLDGAVSNVGEGDSDLPDPAVRSCVVRAFYGLSFPQPEGGIVTVAYPISFSSLEPSAPAKKPMAFTPGE